MALTCGSAEGCEYQEYPAFDEEAVETSERIGTPEEIQKKIRGVEKGESRLQELYGTGVYDDVVQAMEIVGRYTKGATNFNPGNLQDVQAMSEDVVLLSALSTRVAVVFAQVQADAKQLDAWRSRLHGDKYMTIKESYRQGLRLGKPTERLIDYQVRRDKEYNEAVDAALKAERQAMVLKSYYDAVVELVNALKKRIDTMRDEMKHVGRS